MTSLRTSVPALSTRPCNHTRAVLPAQTRAARLVVRAELNRIAPPAGVTLPTQEPVVPPPSFGFVNWAEKINGRACMIGFFALIAIEAISGQGFLQTLGFNIGNGLGFEL